MASKSVKSFVKAGALPKAAALAAAKKYGAKRVSTAGKKK